MAAASAAVAEFELLPALVEDFPCLVAALGEVGRPIELAFRKVEAGLLLRHSRARLVDRALRLHDLRLRLLERRFEVARIHAGDDLAARDHIAFLDEDVRDTPGEFGVDVDLVGLEPPVAPGDPGRPLLAALLPPIGAADRYNDEQADEQERLLPAVPRCHAHRKMQGDRLRQLGSRRCLRPRRYDLAGRVRALDLGLLAQNSLRVAESRDNHQTFRSRGCRAAD